MNATKTNIESPRRNHRRCHRSIGVRPESAWNLRARLLRMATSQSLPHLYHRSIVALTHAQFFSARPLTRMHLCASYLASRSMVLKPLLHPAKTTDPRHHSAKLCRYHTSHDLPGLHRFGSRTSTRLRLISLTKQRSPRASHSSPPSNDWSSTR